MINYKKGNVIICLLILLCVVGCSKKENINKKITTIKIGITVYKQDDTFIATILSNIEKYIKEIETLQNTKINITIMDGKGNQTLQNEHVDKFLAHNYDVICVNIVDRTSASTIIDKVKTLNIPIIFFNREPVEEDMQRWDKVFYVGSNSSESGILQGQIIVDEYNKNPLSIDKNGDGKLQYIMLEGEQGHQDALIRTEYCIKIVSAMNIKVQKLATGIANWQRAQANTKTTQWIDTFGSEIEVVFSNNDDMALGAIDAFKSKQVIPMPVIVGVDATPPALNAVKEGVLLGTVLNDSKRQAESIAKLAYLLATKQNFNEQFEFTNKKYIMIPCTAITADNVDKFASESER